MTKTFRTMLAVLLLTPALALAQASTPLNQLPAGTYALDKTHASLIWKVNHMGLSMYTARFTDFDATLKLDTRTPVKSSVVATINPASVRTDYPNAKEKDFDAKLANDAEWLNSGTYPEIRFESTKLELKDDTSGVLTGNLTFMGVTKPVALDVTFNGGMLKHPFAGGPAVGFAATGSLKRSDFGLSTYIPMVGDEVQLQIQAEFVMPPKAGATK